MEFWSWTIAVILGLSAIVSPIITTVINNCHQTKIKKMDMYENAKRNVLSEFIMSAQASIFNSDHDTMLEYITSLNKLFIYFSNISLESLKPFDHARAEVINNYSDEKYRIANRELNKIVFSLSKQIDKK